MSYAGGQCGTLPSLILAPCPSEISLHVAIPPRQCGLRTEIRNLLTVRQFHVADGCEIFEFLYVFVYAFILYTFLLVYYVSNFLLICHVFINLSRLCNKYYLRTYLFTAADQQFT